jgi:ribosomal small subunit protein bTHX
MGRGDKKSAKGKRSKGSYGVTRNRKKIREQIKRAASTKPATPAVVAEAKPKKAAKKKAEA